jgi:hypothetical protein
VKGLAGKASWPVDHIREANPRHFIVFVCFLGKIREPEVAPEVWIIPLDRLEPLIYHSPRGRRVVQRSKLRAVAKRFKNAWSLVASAPQSQGKT